MIKLSNGMEFKYETHVKDYIDGMRSTLRGIKSLPEYSWVPLIRLGREKAKSTAIAAVEVAIENAELDYKAAQHKEEEMKAVKKAVKPVAKKPAVKKSVAKKAAAKKK